MCDLQAEKYNASIKYTKYFVFLILASILPILFLVFTDEPIMPAYLLIILIIELLVFLIGVFLVFKLRKPRRIYVNRLLLMCELSIPILFFTYIFVFSPTISKAGYFHLEKSMCQDNLGSLKKAIGDYFEEFESYPSSEKWSILLIENLNLPKTMFLCPSVSEDKSSHYAMNSKVKPDSSDDVVLLFESKPGWNQHGGPELIDPSHHDGKGCNILFNDGHVEFVKIEDFDKLRWE